MAKRFSELLRACSRWRWWVISRITPIIRGRPCLSGSRLPLISSQCKLPSGQRMRWCIACSSGAPAITAWKARTVFARSSGGSKSRYSRSAGNGCRGSKPNSACVPRDQLICPRSMSQYQAPKRAPFRAASNCGALSQLCSERLGSSAWMRGIGGIRSTDFGIGKP
ncbi:hypothetical protein D3C71_1008240 [compost metagenome]